MPTVLLQSATFMQALREALVVPVALASSPSSDNDGATLVGTLRDLAVARNLAPARVGPRRPRCADGTQGRGAYPNADARLQRCSLPGKTISEPPSTRCLDVSAPNWSVASASNRRRSI